VTVFAGGIIYAADINALKPTILTKGGSTSRTSTTTYAIDPDLQGISLTAGTYYIQLIGFFTTPSWSTNPKIKTQWRFTGTWTPFNRLTLGPGSDNTSAPTLSTSVDSAGVVVDSQDAVYSTYTGGAYASFREEAYGITVSAPGTLGLYWAPSVSASTATTLQNGSTFSVLKYA
jgi:hypothetical protein